MERSADHAEPALEAEVVPLTREHVGADDGIRTRDPHLGKALNWVFVVPLIYSGAALSTQFPRNPAQ